LGVQFFIALTTKFKYLIFIVLFLTVYNLKSQELLGLGFSNYSGISGRNINPAFLTGSKVFLDVNLVSASVFLENNFAYIPKNDAFIRRLLQGEGLSKNYGPYKYNSFYTYYKNNSNYSFASNLSVTGPSFMLQVGKQTFGAGMAMRSYNSFYDFPGQILRTWYNGSPDTGVIALNAHFKDVQLASLTWGELFFNYAVDIVDRYGDKLTAGIELKYLFGVEGFYIAVDDLKYHWISANEIKVDTLNARVGFAIPLDYNNLKKTNYNPWAKGHGVGINIGIVYTKNKSSIPVKEEKPLCATPYEDYRYRIGLSVMDIGSVRFDRFAQMYQSDVSNITKTLNSFQNDYTVNSIVNYFDPLISTSSTAAPVFMSLPTAVSLQFDYHFTNSTYLSGYWSHPLRFNSRSLRRPAQLAVIPRYETRLIGLSLPLSLYDYQKLRMGLSIRLYTLTIGTEKLGSLLGINDFNGIDFYFNIKFNLQKGKCSPWKTGACGKVGKYKRKKVNIDKYLYKEVRK